MHSYDVFLQEKDVERVGYTVHSIHRQTERVKLKCRDRKRRQLKQIDDIKIILRYETSEKNVHRYTDKENEVGRETEKL